MQLGSHRPIYSQLVDLLIMAILDRSLQAGAQLLPVADMAMRQQVNPQAVERAYAELEKSGVVQKAANGQLQVSDNAVELLRESEARRFMRYELPLLLRRLELLGLDPNQIDWAAAGSKPDDKD